jgi:hypothetical protein
MVSYAQVPGVSEQSGSGMDSFGFGASEVVVIFKNVVFAAGFKEVGVQAVTVDATESR